MPNGVVLRWYGEHSVAETTRAWAQTLHGRAPLVGEPARHLSREELERAFAGFDPVLESERASLQAIVIRRPDGFREQPTAAELSRTGGLVGDRWATGKADPGDQVSMMNVDVAARLANGQSIGLFGDNLFTDLDLRETALPEGAELRIGEAVVRVSATPHVPCDRFRARFGHPAFVFAAATPRIRGVYLTVVAGGAIAVGDAVHRLG